MLFFTSKMEMFEAPAGIVATWKYPIGKESSVNVWLTGLHTVPPQRTAPLFIKAPVKMPLLCIAYE